MAGKCHEEWVQCRKDKEGDREIEQKGPQYDEVV